MAAQPVYLTALGIVSALGHGKAQVLENLMAGNTDGMVRRTDLMVNGAPAFVGQVDGDVPDAPAHLSDYASRNFSLSIVAAEEIRGEIDAAIRRHGASRIAVVMGTSTSGIAEGEDALQRGLPNGALPEDFNMRKQEPGSVGEALARYLGLSGPAYTVSTACSSGAKAIESGRRLLRTGLADAVLAGGADSLCRLTLNGFHALAALSGGICNPMSRNRDGTSIGEGAAVFLMHRDEAEIALYGAGASTDAYSMTAPDAEGLGVESAVRRALNDAGLAAAEIDYIQLHGTGTLHNDTMESKAVQRVFDNDVPCSSSKGQLGHTLGAAGAMGAAHCWLTASGENHNQLLPPHIWDGEADEGLLSETLVKSGQTMDSSGRGMFLSNAFAFGGNNATLIIGRTRR
jgi:3-oxoacyl-[acyl-carrier-protein] synthase I